MIDSTISVEEHGDVVVVRPLQSKVTGSKNEESLMGRLRDLIAQERATPSEGVR